MGQTKISAAALIVWIQKYQLPRRGGGEATDISDYRLLERFLHSFADTVGSPSKIKYSAFLGVKNVKGLSRLFGANMMEIKVAEINAEIRLFKIYAT